MAKNTVKCGAFKPALMLPSVLFLCCMLGACSKNTVKVTLPDGAKIKAELAITPQETEKGLMFRKELAKNRGMLFVFEKDESRMFWMKNTLIDLDMVFITSDGIVNNVAERVPHSYVYTPDNQVEVRGGFGRYVLELAAGSAKEHNITEGSKITFKLPNIKWVEE